MIKRVASSSVSGQAQGSETGSGALELWGRRLSDWTPYLTLAFSVFLSFVLIPTGKTLTENLVILVLAVAAGAWVFRMYTRAPQPRRDYQPHMRIYFAGLLLIGSILMLLQPLFFIFVLTAYFHASVLRPLPLIVVGVGLTSTLIDTILTGFPWATVQQWSIFVPLIAIQTFTVGLGSMLSERLADVSEQRRQAVSQLQLALEENAGLHAQLVTQAREAGVLDERQRMAREIHDTLAQGLIGIITQLEAAQASGRSDESQRHLNNATSLARKSLSEARRSVQASRPEQLENATLPDALTAVARQWSAINEVPVEFAVTGEPLPLHPEIEVALLRTAQEALSNVARHAQASRVGLTLSYMGDVVTLDVRDDGVGFEANGGTKGSPTEEGAGFGLTAMRQRVNRIAGTLVVESEPGGGTAISARVPSIGAQSSAEPAKSPREALKL